MKKNKYDYDLVTIGAGSGGVRATRMAAEYGARACIIEESRVGGTCVIRGCVPKKLLVYAAHFADDFADSGGFGWNLGDKKFDWARLITAKNQEIDRLNGIYINNLKKAGAEIIEGRGVLTDPHTVEVGGRSITARHILIAVGSRPSMLKVPGIKHAISSNEALDLMALPKRIAIVGAGYIAVEFAGIFNALGVEVTEILRADKVLRGFDEDIRTLLGDEMVKRGIDLRTETTVASIAKQKDGYMLSLSDNTSLKVDLVMYATGRAPNTDGLGLVEAGVDLDRKGAVVVDQYSQSSVPSIYAVGDVTDRVNLTPVAIKEGAAVAETLFNDNPGKVDHTNIPTAVFSQPPIGTVGLTEEQARAKKKKVDVYTSQFKPMKHTLSGRDEISFMKMVVEHRSDRVLGCHMLGGDAPEIIQGLGVAMKCRAKKSHFDATVGVHPSAAEEFVTMKSKRD